MGIKQLYNDHLRKLPNAYGDFSVMNQTLFWVLGEITLLKSVTIGTTLKQHQNKYSAVGIFGAPKDLS